MIQVHQPTAQILQFPVGGRFGLGDLRRSTKPEAAMPRTSALGAGESWYHAEAIEAAQQAMT